MPCLRKHNKRCKLDIVNRLAAKAKATRHTILKAESVSDQEVKPMFWKAVGKGFALFGCWQVWLATACYMAIHLVLLVISAGIAGEGESGIRVAAGFSLYAIVGRVFHGMLTSLLVALLLPILLGGSSVAPISEIVSSLWMIVKIGVIAIAVVSALSLLPFIGSVIHYTPGIGLLLEGPIVFRLLCRRSIDQVLAAAGIPGSVYPGFWQFLGFTVIAWLVTRLIMLGMGLLSTLLEDTPTQELVLMITAPVVGVLGGLTSLFIYSSYVRLSVIRLIA